MQITLLFLGAVATGLVIGDAVLMPAFSGGGFEGLKISMYARDFSGLTRGRVSRPEVRSSRQHCHRPAALLPWVPPSAPSLPSL